MGSGGEGRGEGGWGQVGRLGWRTRHAATRRPARRGGAGPAARVERWGGGGVAAAGGVGKAGVLGDLHIEATVWGEKEREGEKGEYPRMVVRHGRRRRRGRRLYLGESRTPWPRHALSPGLPGRPAGLVREPGPHSSPCRELGAPMRAARRPSCRARDAADPLRRRGPEGFDATSRGPGTAGSEAARARWPADSRESEAPLVPAGSRLALPATRQLSRSSTSYLFSAHPT